MSKQMAMDVTSMLDVKNNSTNFINDHSWIRGEFSWQKEYGAFSYSHSQITNVYNYFLNQE